jgi:hypothetical protein
MTSNEEMNSNTILETYNTDKSSDDVGNTACFCNLLLTGFMNYLAMCIVCAQETPTPPPTPKMLTVFKPGHTQPSYIPCDEDPVEIIDHVNIDGTMYLPVMRDNKTEYLLPIVPFNAGFMNQTYSVTPQEIMFTKNHAGQNNTYHICETSNVMDSIALKLLKSTTDPNTQWYYIGDDGTTQGPFIQTEMRIWWLDGMLREDLPIKCKGMSLFMPLYYVFRRNGTVNAFHTYTFNDYPYVP